MENNRRFPLVLSGFWLKVIALLTMTIDHIGFLFTSLPCAGIFRCIGRLALPLFCFMIAEGAIHTKNFRKYALRLGIMASVISIAMIVMETPLFDMSMRDQGIIFIDLLLGAVAVYLLRQKQWYFKALAFLPLAYGIASEVAASLESCGCMGHILWFPFFMRTQYGWYGILMIIGFYVAYLIADVFIKNLATNSGIDPEAYKGTRIERNAINIISMMTLVFISLVRYLVRSMIPPQYVAEDYVMQLLAMCSGVFILLYSGARGYNKKWFQYGSYLYYPVHLLILYGIFYLIYFI